jgi:peptidoglycan hydrolase CwlO-like protein
VKYALVVLAAAWLASCKDMPQARTEAEIRDIASDAAADATADEFSNVSGRLDDLESKVNELESQKSDLAGQLADEERKSRELEDEVESIRAKVGY